MASLLVRTDSQGLRFAIGPGLSNLLVKLQVEPPQIAYDSFEEYRDGDSLNDLHSFSPWANHTGSLVVYFLGPYVDRARSTGIQSSDTFETYVDSASVNGLNGGSNWAGSYVDRPRAFGNVAGDDMESYINSASLNGLNGGVAFNSFAGWQGSYVNHDN